MTKYDSQQLRDLSNKEQKTMQPIEAQSGSQETRPELTRAEKLWRSIITIFVGAGVLVAADQVANYEEALAQALATPTATPEATYTGKLPAKTPTEAAAEALAMSNVKKEEKTKSQNALPTATPDAGISATTTVTSSVESVITKEVTTKVVVTFTTERTLRTEHELGDKYKSGKMTKPGVNYEAVLDTSKQPVIPVIYVPEGKQGKEEWVQIKVDGQSLWVATVFDGKTYATFTTLTTTATENKGTGGPVGQENKLNFEQVQTEFPEAFDPETFPTITSVLEGNTVKIVNIEFQNLTFFKRAEILYFKTPDNHTFAWINANKDSRLNTWNRVQIDLPTLQIVTDANINEVGQSQLINDKANFGGTAYVHEIQLGSSGWVENLSQKGDASAYDPANGMKEWYDYYGLLTDLSKGGVPEAVVAQEKSGAVAEWLLNQKVAQFFDLLKTGSKVENSGSMLTILDQFGEPLTIDTTKPVIMRFSRRPLATEGYWKSPNNSALPTDLPEHFYTVIDGQLVLYNDNYVLNNSTATETSLDVLMNSVLSFNGVAATTEVVQMTITALGLEGVDPSAQLIYDQTYGLMLNDQPLHTRLPIAFLTYGLEKYCFYFNGSAIVPVLAPVTTLNAATGAVNQ